MNGRKQISFAPSSKTHQKSWYVVDATDRILGRLATRVATVLMGKHKPTYASYMDTGDFVIVLNAEKIKLSGKKSQTKVYQTFSRYPGGRKEISFEKMITSKPDEVIRLAVKRMLPPTVLGRHMIMKLKVYAGKDHPHQAQNPLPLEVR